MGLGLGKWMCVQGLFRQGVTRALQLMHEDVRRWLLGLAAGSFLTLDSHLSTPRLQNSFITSF